MLPLYNLKKEFDMTTMSTTKLSHNAVANNKVFSGALLLIVASLLSFAPMVILGPTIGWPASLRNPAADQLMAIARSPQAVALGYSVYLLYSVLLLPVMVFVARRIYGSLTSAGAVMVVAFAAISVLTRCIGILRWLTVMPELAQQHAKAGEAQRSAIELVFQAVTIWGGGIGELLGVSLFMALSVGIAMTGAWLHRSLPRWLIALGAVSAVLLLAMMLPVLGVAIKVPVAIAVSALTVWMLATGIWFWVNSRSH
jgi:Domain of unknown function (DUF4386)